MHIINPLKTKKEKSTNVTFYLQILKKVKEEDGVKMKVNEADCFITQSLLLMLSIG